MNGVIFLMLVLGLWWWILYRYEHLPRRITFGPRRLGSLKTRRRQNRAMRGYRRECRYYSGRC